MFARDGISSMIQNLFFKFAIDSLNQLWFSNSDGVFKITSGNINPAVKRMYQNTQCQHFNISSAGMGNATFRYVISNPSNISIEMYDLQGKSVQVLKKGFHDKGSYQLNWNYKKK